MTVRDIVLGMYWLALLICALSFVTAAVLELRATLASDALDPDDQPRWSLALAPALLAAAGLIVGTLLSDVRIDWREVVIQSFLTGAGLLGLSRLLSRDHRPGAASSSRGVHLATAGLLVGVLGGIGGAVGA